MELMEEQEQLLKQIVHSFRLGVGGEEGPTWEEHERERELRVLGLLAEKYGYHLHTNISLGV